MTHLPPLLRDLTFLLLTAALVTLVFRRLRLPLVIGYLVAGILVGPFAPLIPSGIQPKNLEVWAEIGVIFLLFALGLEFSYKRLVRLGQAAFTTGFFEIFSVFGLSFLLAKIMGWPTIESLFFGGALCISSTSIIVKSFADLKLKGRHFVSLVYGILLVEDLVAVLLLVLLSTVAVSQTVSEWSFLESVVRFLFFLILCFVLGMYLVPLLLQKVRRLLSDETLLIVSVGLCLLMVFAATEAGFSSALGAFLMGSILAGTPEGPKIEERLVPLRDLFAAIFFVSIGMMINLSTLWENLGLVVGISLFLITAKFSAVTVGSLLAGQTLRWSLQSGLSLTQIGEFSFLMAQLGNSLEAISPRFFPLIVLVSAMTSFTTPFLLRFANPLVEGIERRLPPRLGRQLEILQRTVSPGRDLPWFRLLWRAYGLKFLVNTVVIIGVSLLSRNFLWPFLTEHWPFSVRSLQVGMLIGTILACLPFFWAVLIAQPRRSAQFSIDAWERIKSLQIFVFLARLALTAVLLVFLVSRFVSVRSSLWLFVAVLFAFFLLRRRLEEAYRAIETRFLNHLNEKEREELNRTSGMQQLAPWDAHLEELRISAESPHLAQTYAEAGLREQYGITVAMVERGSRKILAPGREERILPGDLLFVIGTEDQVLRARAALEIQAEQSAEAVSEDFGLEFFILEPDSPYCGKSIRDSGLRENVEGLIVGLERSGRRHLNPDSGMVLEPYDLLWIVGSRERIEQEQRLKPRSPRGKDN